MYANGFFEQQRRSPVSLAAVIGLHGAAIAALALYGTTQYVADKGTHLQMFNVPIAEPPPPNPPPPPQPQTDQRVSTPPERVTIPPANDPPLGSQTGTVTPERPYQPPTTPQGPQLALNTTPAVPPPIRRAAQVDPNYRDALQPPYPRAMEQAQRNGSVHVRITIGTDGRVSAIEQLSATDDAFWRVTQRQALGRWRFRPATVDGRPIVSTMVMTVTFRIPDDG